MKKLLLVAVVMMLALFAFTACRNDEDEPTPGAATPATTPTPTPAPLQVGEEAAVVPDLPEEVETGHPLDQMNAVVARFPMSYSNDLPHVEGTIFQYAMVRATPWIGLFGGSVFWDQGDDNTLGSFIGTTTSLVAASETGTFTNDGVVSVSINHDNMSITYTMQVDVYWHDGTPLTLDDLVFAYYVIANPEYTGVRFTGAVSWVVGIVDYRNGNADHIAGLVLSNNNRTLTKYFDRFPPEIVYTTSAWHAPLPRHIFEGMAVEDMPNSDAVRVNPIGWGPFMVEHIVAGESMSLVRNENFVWGVPYIERMVINRITPDLVPAAMEAGEFDFAPVHTEFFDQYQYPATNMRFMGFLGSHYRYITFRLGHWTSVETGEYNDEGEPITVMRNVYDPNREMANVYLRRAMAYALDHKTLGETFYHGLRFPAGSFMSPMHIPYMDLSVPMWHYNPERANQILDDAGFPMGGDGYRTWPDGSDLTIVWATQEGPSAEFYYMFYTQAWRAIGLRVVLWRDSFHHEFYLFDVLDVDDDNDEIHIYNHGWTAGTSPNPRGRWGHIFWNPSRYNSPEWENILDRIESAAAWDDDYRRQVYSDMQWYLYNNVFFFPTTWGIGLQTINNRVTNWENRPGQNPRYTGWHTIRLSAAEPYRR